jgi:hypothetical protein
MNGWYSEFKQWKDRGQSLVEIALFLPILIFVLAGLVEVSNLLITQNRVTTASRIAAGFGASNFNADDWADVDPETEECIGGTACAMGAVAINTVTETMNLSPELWDVWSINATFDAAGTDFKVFTHTHAYGIYEVVPEIQWSQIITQVKNDMMTNLQGASAGTGNLSVVAAVAYHNIGTILGVPMWQWTGLQTIRGLTVMRVDEKPAFLGCPMLPITIRLQQWSIYPTNWEELDGPNISLSGTAPVDLFPEEIDWEYPGGHPSNPPAPIYSQLLTPTQTTRSVISEDFTENVPGVHLASANPGYLYWARDVNNDPSGNFGWLSWQDAPDANALGVSLWPPGDFIDPDPDDGIPQGYKGSEMDLGTGEDCPWADTGNEDGYLATKEWVANATGNMNANVVNDSLQYYVDTKTPVFLLVFDYTNQGDGPVCDENPGENIAFHIIEFAKVELVGYQYTGNEKWIVFKFLGWGLQCNSPDPS